jgi:general stress protein 26
MEKTNDVQHFARLIKDIKFAMLTTVNADDGSLRSRPMTLQQAQFDGDLWFFAGRSTQAALDVAEEPKVNLAFSEPKNSSYISACGSAEVVLDKAKAKELWNPLYKAWFPEGLEDPDLCLIKVTVESVDYWESPSSPVVQLAGFAKAMLSGKKAGDELGRRGHLNIN